jgi:tetratricopeptide (TPR) repeat protein
MHATWEERIARFWADADDAQPDRMLSAMRRLVDERLHDDPDAIFEWASVHDFVGREEDAIPLYRSALAHGLAGERELQAVIQLASSLRNVGLPDAAVALLADRAPDDTVGAAAQAFLALALSDAGRPDEAVRIALLALAPTLPMYGSAVSRYAEELIEEAATD